MLGLTAGLHDADAAPRADGVIVWAPGRDVAPIAAAARDAGAALVDRSPPAVSPPALDAAVAHAIELYELLKLDDAWTVLEAARRELDRPEGATIDNTRLSDLFVYRGLISTQRGDADHAWEDWVQAIVVAPERVFDPARFAPRAIDELERARKAATRTRATIKLAPPPGCVLVIDGIARPDAEVTLVAGTHWARAQCPGSGPWARRFDASEDTAPLRPEPPEVAGLSEADALIQARVAAARGVVLVEVRGELARARRLALDGRELDRASVAIGGGRDALVPVAQLVTRLLAPEPPRGWYRAPWVWAVVAAGLATAIAVPITIAATRDRPRTATITGSGLP